MAAACCEESPVRDPAINAARNKRVRRARIADAIVNLAEPCSSPMIIFSPSDGRSNLVSAVVAFLGSATAVNTNALGEEWLILLTCIDFDGCYRIRPIRFVPLWQEKQKSSPNGSENCGTVNPSAVRRQHTNFTSQISHTIHSIESGFSRALACARAAHSRSPTRN